MGSGDFDIDKEILDGLQGVSKRNTASNPDTKHVVISLFIGSERTSGIVTGLQSVANPMIYEIGLPINERSYEFISRTIHEHIAKYGSVDEIMIASHGDSGTQGIPSEGDRFSLTYFLNDQINKLEKEFGKKIANRIVFAGCKTFSELKDADIIFLSDFAKKHQMEIVGTTSVESGGALINGIISYHSGRFVQFSPSGEIIRDKKLDCPYNPFSLLCNDTSWTDFYIGHTAEEGAAIKHTYEIQQKKRKGSSH